MSKKGLNISGDVEMEIEQTRNHVTNIESRLSKEDAEEYGKNNFLESVGNDQNHVVNMMEGASSKNPRSKLSNFTSNDHQEVHDNIEEDAESRYTDQGNYKPQSGPRDGSKIELLKSNLNNLESKVQEIREKRDKKKQDAISQQVKMNKVLQGIVDNHKVLTEKDDISKDIQEQVDHTPNSLTKENIKLRQENDKLKQMLLAKNGEIDKISMELKHIRKSRDDALDRVEELTKIVDSNQSQINNAAQEENKTGADLDEAMRRNKNLMLQKKAAYAEEVRKDDVNFWKTTNDAEE